MTVRVVVELSADADWAAVAELLRIAGADVRPPREGFLDHIVAIFPAGVNPEEAAAAAQAIPGVEDAYPDAWRISSTP